MFGLGDRTFEHFNECSRTYYKFFRKYNMQEFFPYDVGSDHEGNIESDFIPWKSNFLSFMKKTYLKNGAKPAEKQFQFIKGVAVTLE